MRAGKTRSGGTGTVKNEQRVTVDGNFELVKAAETVLEIRPAIFVAGRIAN